MSAEESTSALSGMQSHSTPEQKLSSYTTHSVCPSISCGCRRDQGIEFDQAGFDHAMDEQKPELALPGRAAAKQTANPAYQQLPKSVFEGYRQTRSDGCEVLAIIQQRCSRLQELESLAETAARSYLDHTPFYADSGGQVGDKGWFYSDDHNTIVAEVTGCYAPIQGVRRASGRG